MEKDELKLKNAVTALNKWVVEWDTKRKNEQGDWDIQYPEMNLDSFYDRMEIEKEEALWEEYMMDDAEICIVAFGVAARVSKNAIDAAREKGIKVGMIRPITLWPFPKDALKKAAGTLDSLFDYHFPYMMCMYQSPVNGEDTKDYYHFHIAFYPPMRSADKQKFNASSETGAWAHCNPTAPEEKAEELRAAYEKFLRKDI
jgi:hypothetical protein